MSDNIQNDEEYQKIENEYNKLKEKNKNKIKKK